MPDPQLLAAAGNGPLADLPPSARDQVLRACTVFRADAGQRFYQPGRLVGMHLVLSGLVRVAMSSREGRQLTIRYARTGDILGAPIVVSQAGVPVSVQAVTDVTIARTPADLLWTIVTSVTSEPVS